MPERFNEFISKYDKVYSELHQWIIRLERNAITNSQYTRGETIELNPIPADEDDLEESICKALLPTGFNVVPEYLYSLSSHE